MRLSYFICHMKSMTFIQSMFLDCCMAQMRYWWKSSLLNRRMQIKGLIEGEKDIFLWVPLLPLSKSFLEKALWIKKGSKKRDSFGFHHLHASSMSTTHPFSSYMANPMPRHILAARTVSSDCLYGFTQCCHNS